MATVTAFPEALDSLPFLQQITIASGSCRNGTIFDIQNMKRLRSISIGKDCFTLCISQLILSNLPLLESFELGSNSFLHVQHMTMMNMEKLSRIEFGTSCLQGVLQDCEDIEATFCNLPSLTKLEFPNFSFKHFSYPKLQSLPALLQLSFGQECFGGIPSHPIFGLSDFPSLTTATFGKGCFGKHGGCSIQSLPSLQTVIFENNSFASQADEVCNGLIIRSCPKLELLDLHATCFPNASNLVLEGMEV